MAAMMPSGGGGGSSQSANPYEHYDNPSLEGDDLIDPDDGELMKLLQSLYIIEN